MIKPANIRLRYKILGSPSLPKTSITRVFLHKHELKCDHTSLKSREIEHKYLLNH